MYIVGNSTKKGQIDEIIYKSGDYFTGDPSDSIILENIVLRFGGTSADYSVVHIDEKSEEFKKITEQDLKYKLSWDGNNISGVDFSEYESWKVLKISSDKNIINPNETVILSLSACDVNDNLDTSYSGTIIIDYKKGFNTLLQTPLISFDKGTATFNFIPTVEGFYNFPSDKWSDKRNNLKIKEQILIKVRLVLEDSKLKSGR